MNKKAFLAKSSSDYQKLGIKKETAIWEDGMRTNGGKGTYEWWYFDSEYTDGTKIVVVFYTKNLFDVKGPGNPTASINITFPDGKTIEKSISAAAGEKNNASKEKCDVRIGQSSIMYLDGNYLIHFIDEGVEYTCTMKPKLPMWRPKTAHLYFGEKQEYYFAWFVAQPSAQVNATLKIEGKTIELEGNGYHDHNWGNIQMNKLMNHWYWCRGNIGPYTIIACDIIAEKKYGYSRFPIFMVGKDGKILEDNEEKTVIQRLDTKYHPMTKKFIDNHLVFINQGENSISYKIEFIRENDIVYSSLLDTIGLSKIKIFAAKSLRINPTYIRCIGKVKLTVEENGEKEVFEQEALWEQMFFGSNKDAIIGN